MNNRILMSKLPFKKRKFPEVKESKEKENKEPLSVGIPCSLERKDSDTFNMVSEDYFDILFHSWGIGDFDIEEHIGTGSFGVVYRAKEKESKCMVALKILKQDMESDKGRIMPQEIEIQRKLRHQNIIQLLCWFRKDDKTVLCLEYAAKGSLSTLLKQRPNGRFGEAISSRYILKICEALNFCHENNVIHCDLKPDNILLTSTNEIKLCDFGLSVYAKPVKPKNKCGTWNYIAPETILHKPPSIYIDHWALGVVCYEFLTGKTPFSAPTIELISHNILTLNYLLPRHLSEDAEDLIKKLLVYKPEDRLFLKGVMRHDWIRNFNF